MSLFIELDVIGLTTGQTQGGTYTLILGERNGNRKLPIVIGTFEAQSIALFLQDVPSERPLTHDLFNNFAKLNQTSIDKIEIVDLKEGVFFANIIGKNSLNETYRLDSRTSDAIAIAIRAACKIYVHDKILNDVGLEFEFDEFLEPERYPLDDEMPSELSFEELIKNMKDNELYNELERSIQIEDYDKAALIRDELRKRNLS